jgi:hypothetical protein
MTWYALIFKKFLMRPLGQFGPDFITHFAILSNSDRLSVQNLDARTVLAAYFERLYA